jgi:multidrug efflux pump subunit AcrA (membrane-fusion protein)
MPSKPVIKLAVSLAVVAVLFGTIYFTRGSWKPWLVKKLADDAAATKDEHDEHGHAHGEAERIKLSPQAQANLKLFVESLVPETYPRTLLIPGMIVDRPGLSDRGVISPVAGVVTEVKIQPGDTVKAGETLFTVRILSELLQTTQAELLKATKDLQIASENLALLRKASSDVVAGQRLIEAENIERRHKVTITALRQDLLNRGLKPEQVDRAATGEFATEITITTPTPLAMSGPLVIADPKNISTELAALSPAFEVKDLKARLGEQIQAGQVLCVLANHRLLYVEGRGFKSEAGLLEKAAQNGWNVNVEFAEEVNGWPAFNDGLTIRHLANTIDPVSRTFAFYLPLQNQSRTYVRDGQTFLVWRFRPGQRARLKVPVEIMEDVFVLPSGAIVREGAEAYVFRQNGDLFERRPVRVLYEDRGVAVLANDGSIAPAIQVGDEKIGGDAIARNGAAALNRALKAAAGAHEEHDHDH